MVEVELDKPFLEKVVVEDDLGTIEMVNVMYFWLLSKCVSSEKLDHKTS